MSIQPEEVLFYHGVEYKYGRVLRYFERVSVAKFFSIVAEIYSILLFVASCHKLFVAGCQMTLYLEKE